MKQSNQLGDKISYKINHIEKDIHTFVISAAKSTAPTIKPYQY